MDRRSRRRGGEFSFNSPPTSTSTVETIVDAPPPYYIRFYRTICKFIPILHWLPSYRHRWWDLKNDVLAGLTVGVMLIPQSMAYSLIVGLPPVYGLYTALLPLIIYSILGTSNQLAVGPTAITSLMVASSLNTLVQSNTMPEQISVTELYIAFALVLSVLCGSVQLLLGVCRLGFLVNFLSHPVLSGFTSAAAIIIAVSQLGHFFGVSSLMTNSQGQVYEIVWSMIKLVPQFHYPTILLGVGCLGILVFLDRFRLTLNRTSLRFKLLGREFNLGNRFSFKQYPAALIIVIISVLAVFIASKADVNNGGEKQVFGIRIVGHVPSKLPAPHIPRIPARGTLRKQLLKEMILLSFPVALVAFMESISISKFYALQRGYDIDPNQELIASGVANLVGGFFQAFPASGSISRTAVNANANAVTPLSGIISFLLVLLTLLLLTPLFYYLPMAALAAIIIYSCFKIPDIDEAVFTFKTKKRDFLLMILTFLCTLFVGIMQGILIGAAASLALVIYRSSKPRFRLLGRQPGTNMYRECKKATGTATTPSSTVIQYPGIVIARFEADIYFANMSFFKDRIKRFIKRAKQPVHIFILDCSSINQVDSTAIEAIKELQPILAKMDIELYMAQLKPTIREVMDRGGAIRYIDEFFDDLHCAVVSAERKLCSKSQVAPTTTALTQTQSQNQSDTVVPSISTASSGDHAINPEGNVDKVENRDQTEIEMRDLSRLQQQQNASFS